jgi:hypothetical protein
MAECRIGGIEFAQWIGERPSVERVDVVITRRPGIEGVGSALLPKYGRAQTIDAVSFCQVADRLTLAGAIRLLEGTLVVVEYSGLNFFATLGVRHLVQSVDIVEEQSCRHVTGLTYAGVPFEFAPAYRMTARFTLIPVGA